MKRNIVLTGIMGALLLLGLGISVYAQTTGAAYYVSVNGQSYGPYHSDVLKQIARNGTLTESTFVWKADMPEWVKAETVPELAAILASVPRQYKVVVNGQAYGPYGLDSLGKMVQNGTLTENTLVWKAGMPEWVKAGMVSELAVLFSPKESENAPERGAAENAEIKKVTAERTVNTQPAGIYRAFDHEDQAVLLYIVSAQNGPGSGLFTRVSSGAVDELNFVKEGDRIRFTIGRSESPTYGTYDALADTFTMPDLGLTFKHIPYTQHE